MKQAFFLLAVSYLIVPTAYSSQSELNTVQIRIGDFYFKPQTLRLMTDQRVEIELVNEGKVEHEFMVGRGVNMEKEDEAHTEKHGSFEKDFFYGIEVMHTEKGSKFMKVPGHGTMVTLKPGGRATLIFKVPDNRRGQWQIACFMPGHYDAGMKGTLIILERKGSKSMS